jgi:hypothetical protein
MCEAPPCLTKIIVGGWLTEKILSRVREETDIRMLNQMDIIPQDVKNVKNPFDLFILIYSVPRYRIEFFGRHGIS